MSALGGSIQRSWNFAAARGKVLTTMTWCKRILLALPFAVAAVLTVLVDGADRFHLHSERVAGYAFLFGTPWGWLLDNGWFPIPRNHFLGKVVTCALVLWIPALLYSGCLWCVLRSFRFATVKVSERKPSMNSGG